MWSMRSIKKLWPCFTEVVMQLFSDVVSCHKRHESHSQHICTKINICHRKIHFHFLPTIPMLNTYVTWKFVVHFFSDFCCYCETERYLDLHIDDCNHLWEKHISKTTTTTQQQQKKVSLIPMYTYTDTNHLPAFWPDPQRMSLQWNKVICLLNNPQTQRKNIKFMKLKAASSSYSLTFHFSLV